MLIRYIALGTLLVSLIACTHTLTEGEKMIAKSESTRKLGEQWSDGEKSMLAAKQQNKDGNALIKQGNKNIHQGNKLASKGTKQVKTGKSLVKKAKHNTKAAHALQVDSEEQFSTTN